jgi:hypothetical protein
MLLFDVPRGPEKYFQGHNKSRDQLKLTLWVRAYVDPVLYFPGTPANAHDSVNRRHLSLDRCHIKASA